jgi:hypothetical protein
MDIASVVKMVVMKADLRDMTKVVRLVSKKVVQRVLKKAMWKSAVK